ncbi:hypothetical protein H0H92_011265 [Tricholoma furcatifolium]|nr:hypothetical protein H0H92_011265 [Tricholoma furcatifolium]
MKLILVLLACVSASTNVFAAPASLGAKPGRGHAIAHGLQAAVKSLGAASDIAGIASSIDTIIDDTPDQSALGPEVAPSASSTNRHVNSAPVTVVNNGRRRRHRTAYHGNKRELEVDCDLLSRVIARSLLSDLAANYRQREAAEPVAARQSDDELEARSGLTKAGPKIAESVVHHAIDSSVLQTHDHNSTNASPRNFVANHELEFSARDMEGVLGVRGLFGIASTFLKKLVPHASSKVADSVQAHNVTKTRRELV